MTESLLQTTTETGVMRIALDRPNKRNALSRELIRQLHRAVDGAAGDESVRLVVLAANGPAFCAGMDLAEMQDRAGQPNAQQLWKEDTQVYRDLLVAIVTLTKPTLAVVQGPALAGGMGLAMACDLVLARRSRGLRSARTQARHHRRGRRPLGLLSSRPQHRIVSVALRQESHRNGKRTPRPLSSSRFQ